MDIARLYSAKESEGFNLYAIVVDGKCFFKEYINSLDNRNKTQLVALLNRVLHKGLPKDESKFRNIDDNIYELKTRSGARVLCFFGGSILQRSLILTHGTFKSTKKIIKREKDKAIQWRKDYFEHADIIDK